MGTHLMKRIQKGPVRGISLKLQEEERERRMEYVPDRSEVDTDQIHIDADTKEMLRDLNGQAAEHLRLERPDPRRGRPLLSAGEQRGKGVSARAFQMDGDPR